MTKIFVYGTLRKTGRFHHILEKSLFIGAGITPGRLFDVGSFPAAVFAKNFHAGAIVGEVYEVSKATLRQLDNLEGFRAKDMGGSLYLRFPLLVTFESGKVMQAEGYAWNRSVADMPIIPNGDYLKYISDGN